MLPEVSASYVFWEHVYRYKFAAGFVRARRVLDVACGEGYGTAALAACGAASVIGVDVSAAACAHARARYGVDARVGRAEALPLPDASVDLVVSFETLEHLHDPEAFLSECRRVLRPAGALIVSTPNRPVYSPEGHYNGFHHRELDETEFKDLLSAHFRRSTMFGQCPSAAAGWRLRTAFHDQSPYMRLAPLRLVRRLARMALSPGFRNCVTPEVRRDPSRIIRAADRSAAWAVNPYIVRVHRPGNDERPRYLIALADNCA
jgi:SAM-dependent methyltransferase